MKCFWVDGLYPEFTERSFRFKESVKLFFQLFTVLDKRGGNRYLMLFVWESGERVRDSCLSRYQPYTPGSTVSSLTLGNVGVDIRLEYYWTVAGVIRPPLPAGPPSPSPPWVRVYVRAERQWWRTGWAGFPHSSELWTTRGDEEEEEEKKGPNKDWFYFSDRRRHKRLFTPIFHEAIYPWHEVQYRGRGRVIFLLYPLLAAGVARTWLCWWSWALCKRQIGWK